MSKILLIDIDGTLVDYENRLPASAVEAIRKARANLNLASETKSLMRVMENVQHLCSDIERERELDDSFVLDDAAVAQYLRSYTITGALLLTPEGKVECSASTDGLTDDPLTADELPQTLSRTTLLNVADHPQQVYAGRVELEGGSYVDIAACARTDKRGVLVVYYHTTEEYVRNYNLSYQNIVQGYSPQVDGTIVVTRGDQIVASNDASLHQCGRYARSGGSEDQWHRRKNAPCTHRLDRAGVRLRRH